VELTDTSGYFRHERRKRGEITDVEAIAGRRLTKRRCAFATHLNMK